MQFFPTSKIFLSFGSLHITWYAIFSLTGALVTYYLSQRTLKKMGYKESLGEDYFIMMLPIAYIGARIWYCLFEWKQYIADPISIFYVWEGGLAFHGGVIAAVIFGWFFLKKRNVDARRFADACVPNLLIGQAIGRWGNFVNQEAFGGVVSESFFNHFPAFIKEGMFIDGAYRMPTFLFEGVGNLIGFILIYFGFKKFGRKKRGDMAYAYIVWYGVVRFFVEGLRTDSLMMGPIRIAQLISIFGIILGVLGLLGVYDKLFANIWPFKKVKPVVLFDLDGTLLDTEALIADSFRHVFAIYRPDYVLTTADLKGFLGPTLKESFEKYIPEVNSDELIAEYRKFNLAHHDEYVKPFYGVEEVLKTLKEEDYDIGVVSNKTVQTVTHGLEYCGLKDYFPVIVGCEQLNKVKPDPEGLIKACAELYRSIDNVVYVGDSVGDIKTCKNMSAFSVAASFDKTRREELQAAKPCALITSMPQLLDILKEDHEWSDFTTL